MILTNQPYIARTEQRLGFVALDELSPSAPHYRDALDLAPLLKGLDSCLVLGFIYDPVDQRDNRWAVIRRAPNGSQQLVRIVQSQDRTYQKPDHRVLLDLQKHKLDGPNGRQWIKDALTQEERNEKIEAQQRAEEEGVLKDIAAKHLRDIRFSGRDTSKAFIK